ALGQRLRHGGQRYQCPSVPSDGDLPLRKRRTNDHLGEKGQLVAVVGGSIPFHRVAFRSAASRSSSVLPLVLFSHLRCLKKKGQLGPMECGDVRGVSGESAKAWISRPSLGKHICFDGRYLHAAPADLASGGGGGRTSRTRVTFLVNVWLNHAPK
ncbi:unnamed protein product, partial [Scytosiphon promiscuus]